MRAFFDTSALVPIFLADHVHHAGALRWLERARSGEVRGAVALHSAAETYKVLSRYPAARPLDEAGLTLSLRLLLDGPFEVLEPVTSDYRGVIEDLIARGIPGGAVYDALLVRAARKYRADVLLTNNVRDFRRLAPDLAGRIRAP